MSDRTSATIFSNIIEAMLENKLLEDDQKRLITQIYTLSMEYDFSEYQLSDKAQEIIKAYGLWVPN